MAAINDEPVRRAGRRAGRGLRDQGRRLLPRPEHRLHRRAATDRRIPHIRLNEGNLVQLGYGAAPATHLDGRDRPHQCDRRRHRQRQGPHQVSLLQGLRRAGARGAGRRTAPPRPGKPRRTSACRWWSSRPTPTMAAASRSSCHRARISSRRLRGGRCPEGSDVIVERFIRGKEHRLLVVGGKVVAAARGETVIWVTGDGAVHGGRADRQSSSTATRAAATAEEFATRKLHQRRRDRRQAMRHDRPAAPGPDRRSSVPSRRPPWC